MLIHVSKRGPKYEYGSCNVTIINPYLGEMHIQGIEVNNSVFKELIDGCI